MKVLVIGLGSMGKRRIRNLLKLGYKDIIGFDIRTDRINEVNKKYHIKSYFDLDDALAEKPHAMIISTPPNLHKKYAEIAITKKINFFMELNHSSKDVKYIIKKIKGKKIIAYPSSTMIYHPIVKELKKMIKKKTIGKILLINHHNGHFLPNWHPWEDYREFFVSKKETGGAKELVPFELIWLTHIFSKIKSVYANIDKISKLKTDIDDIYQIQLEFKNKIVCNLLLDVISIPSFRETKIIGEKGTILCDFNKGTIKVNKGKGWSTIKLKISKIEKGYKNNTPPEAIYEEEMKRFFSAIKNQKKYPYLLKDEFEILSILDSLENSSKKKRRINV